MIVKTLQDGKYIRVDVRDRNCPRKTCFGYHKWQHRGATNRGSKSSGVDSNYSCPFRNYHGCPPDHMDRIKPRTKK